MHLFDMSKYPREDLPLPREKRDYGISKRLDNLSEHDLKIAQECLDNELLPTLNYKTMFNSGVYVILAAAMDYTKQKEIYDRLQEEGFDTPNAFLKKPLFAKEIVSSARYPNSKFSYILNFANYWTTKVCSGFLSDIERGRKREFELRDKMVKDVVGIAKKSSSLIMIKWGYENVVPIDIWMIRFLKEVYGDKVKYNSIRGVLDSNYDKIEEMFKVEANKRGFSPVFFQNLIWSMYSTFRKRRGIESQGCLLDLLKNEDSSDSLE